MTHLRSATVRALDPTSRRILRTVLHHGPISRSDVAQRTGLSSGSLTRLTKPLLEAGMLAEAEPQSKGHGRPSVPLELVGDSAHFLGVKLIPGKVYAVVSGFTGTVLDELVEAVDTSDLVATAAAIEALARSWTSAAGICGVGVALAGSVDPFGTVRGAHFLGWEEVNFSSLITEATGLPCTTANDVDALTLAQHWMGLGRGLSNFVTLTIGSGVGAGAVIGEQLLVGHQGFSSLVGGLWCSTGNTFHDELSTEAMVAALGMGEAGEVHAHAVERVAELVTFAKHVWGPQRILLTGEGIGPIKERQEELEAAVARHHLTGIDAPEIIIQELEFFDWARGAVALAIGHALRP